MKFKLPDYITGDYAAGTVCFTVRDAESGRKTAVRLYYPCEKGSTAGMKRAEMYCPELLKEVNRQSLNCLKDSGIIYPDCYYGAPHVPDRKFPLIIFNHGFGSYIEANTFLCCDLASNGFVVASSGHAGDSMFNRYDDGTCEYFDKAGNKANNKNTLGKLFGMLAVMYKKGTDRERYERFFDFQNKYMPWFRDNLSKWCAESLDVVNYLKENCSDWIDFSKGIGASGHSFGGATAYYMCHYTDEITCGVNIDGGVFGDYTGLTMKKPFLQISCKTNVYAETKPFIDTEIPAESILFPDMTHAGFMDAKFYLPSVFTGKMDGCEMHRKLADGHIQFFRKHLAGL